MAKKKHRWEKLKLANNKFCCADCGCLKEIPPTGIHNYYNSPNEFGTRCGSIPECTIKKRSGNSVIMEMLETNQKKMRE